MSRDQAHFEQTSVCTHEGPRFALVEGLRVSNLGSLALNRQGQELSPTRPSLRSLAAIMITTSNSPVKRSKMHYQLLGKNFLRDNLDRAEAGPS